MLGCLPQARHTLNKTLYKRWISNPQSGVQLRPLSEVRHVRRVDSGYEVTYRDWWQQDGDERTASAKMLILGAGTLGTNEILRRSHDQGGLSQSGLELQQPLGNVLQSSGRGSPQLSLTQQLDFSPVPPVAKHTTAVPLHTAHPSPLSALLHVNAIPHAMAL